MAVPDVVKIYWSLRALGRTGDAERLRGAWLAVRDGDLAAARELDGMAEDLKGALAALGPSPDARRIREEAALARSCGQAARKRDREDLQERAPSLHPACASPPAPDAAAPGADASAEREPDAFATLRRRLAATNRAGRAWSVILRRRRQARAALAGFLVLAGVAGAIILAVAHRHALVARGQRASDLFSSTWARADAWLGLPSRASPAAPKADPPAAVGTPTLAPRTTARHTARGGAPAARAPALPTARNEDAGPAPAAGRAQAPPAQSPAAPEARGPPRVLFLDLAALRSAQEPAPSAAEAGAAAQ